MASIFLSTPFDMLSPPSWLATKKMYSELIPTTEVLPDGTLEVLPARGEHWLLEKGLLNEDPFLPYSKTSLTPTFRDNVNGVIYRTDTFSLSEQSNVQSVRWFVEDQQTLPDANLNPPGVHIIDMSLREDVFLDYFQAGEQSEFFKELLSGNDLIYGSSGDDKIMGRYGNDNLNGGEGQDSIYAGPGIDYINGGEGDDYISGDDRGVPDGISIDFALYNIVRETDFRDNFSIQQNTVGNWIVRQEGGFGFYNNGVDILNGIDRLVFMDKNVALDIDGVAAVAYRLYKAAFDRIPDLGGLGFWIASADAGVTGLEIAQGFINSPEFLVMYGANSTNADFVDRLYLNILDRPGEQVGRDYWIETLNSGAPREAILLDFSESPENQANVAPLIENGIEYIPFDFA